MHPKRAWFVSKSEREGREFSTTLDNFEKVARVPDTDNSGGPVAGTLPVAMEINCELVKRKGHETKEHWAPFTVPHCNLALPRELSKTQIPCMFCQI